MDKVLFPAIGVLAMSSPRRVRSTRPLTVENLESRALLAGNIQVSVTDGVLNIQGDDAVNFVQIRQLKQTYEGQWPGVRLEISGTNPANHAATTINGEAGPLVVTGVKSGVHIDLGNASDFLRVGNVRLPGGANPESRRETVVNLPGAVSINGGEGDDDIRLYVENNTHVTIDGGDDSDDILVSGSKVRGLSVLSDLASGGVPGSDDITLASVKAKRDVSISAGGGAEDKVRLQGRCVFDGTLDIEGGELTSLLGVEEGESARPTLNGSTTINGRNLNLSANIHGEFIASGLRNAIVSGSSSVNVVISMTAADDRLVLSDFTSVGVTLDGGAGTDELVRRSADLGEETIIGFEIDHEQ